LNTVILSDDISRENKISLFSDIIEDDTIISLEGKSIELNLLVLESKYSDDDIIKLLRPELYLKEGKTDDAIKRFNELIKDNPGNYYAWEKLLLTYSDIGDYDNLFIKGKECATKFNMSYLAKILYASAAIEKEEFGIAQEELRKAKILAGDQNEMILQVLTMEADLYYRQKDYEKSFEAFNEALKMNPDDLIVLNNYAYYLAEQGINLKEAERMASIVVGREKDNSTYLDTYAWVLFKRGKKKDAARIMENIIKSHKEGDADWFEHYGFIMKSLRKCDVAVEYWRRAVDMDKGKTNLIKEIENCSK
jgi:Tfp pilus assembly protein PilF